MLEVLKKLFTSGAFIPHGHCYLWQPGLVWLHVLSDSLIAIAYYSIPITLVYFVRKRVDLPYPLIFLLFGAFIVACGTTHLMEVWTLWHSTYWLSGAIKAVTAVISMYTAAELIPLVPRALALPSPAQLETANRELEREIKERQRTEKTLELHSVIVRSMAEGVCLVRATDGVIVYANPKFESMFGYGADELNEKPVAVLNYDDDEQNAKQVARDIMHQLNKYSEATYEVHNVKKDGTPFWCQGNTSRFEHPEYGTVYVAVHEDISKRKQAEEILKQAKEAAVSEAARSASANRAKSEFLANMSHELRTPLNGILGYAHILKREKNLTVKQENGLDTIQQCGEHLLTLINDILDLSKIEARKMEIRVSDFNLPRFLDNIAAIFRLRATQNNISFCYETFSSLPIFVRGDEQKLRQILINVLGNAIKFTKTGGVVFKVGYHQEKIRFQIEDTGIGIAPEKLTEIFLPFHQIESSHHWVEGTGLGLAISQKLAKLMGTTLEVTSQWGAGSVFWLDLELPDVPELTEIAKTEERNIIGYQGKVRKILVVDDKAENRSVIVNVLEPLGFEIFEATDGVDCLNKALECKPDVILMDLVMPVMDGFEATRQLRQLTELDKIVIIAISASVFDYNQTKSREAGCDDFIPKPVQVQNLLEQLGVYLRLEWVYEDEGGSQAADSDLGGADDDSEGIASNQHALNPNSKILNPKLMAPPPDEIAVLLDLAMRGNTRRILEQAARLEQMDEQFVPFASALRQLTESFQIKQIREFLESYRSSHE
ncbi:MULTISPECIES: PAS domain-containing hybrid sensor histidine kinase/response regulator [unclassified Coleofasciculus]|uniref:PAS domain-containing hybrid sensor histidine kinase/response regulator n=1 Tax=unclassified Coleofasciculus TaxID=2692782 RepID=UPI00187F7490|nr:MULTISPECIES: ATP-binding protein [unclassified Coleofasciculus]MBE9127350.1 response regulator [Coleofasciculus sp. LEGE 07081]MBE9150666.1 response regulator [Coleofasciculus sp. LEGE 07092]